MHRCRRQEQQGYLEGRIRELEATLKAAQVVSEHSGDRIGMGDCVMYSMNSIAKIKSASRCACHRGEPGEMEDLRGITDWKAVLGRRQRYRASNSARRNHPLPRDSGQSTKAP